MVGYVPGWLGCWLSHSESLALEYLARGTKGIGYGKVAQAMIQSGHKQKTVRPTPIADDTSRNSKRRPVTPRGVVEEDAELSEVLSSGHTTRVGQRCGPLPIKG